MPDVDGDGEVLGLPTTITPPLYEEPPHRIRIPRPSPFAPPNARGMSLRASPESPSERAHALVRVLAIRIRRQPLTSLAVAVGIGFVVGGALSCRSGRALLVASLRHVGHEVLKLIL